MTLLLILVFLGIAFGIASFRGAPYLPILTADTARLFELAGLKPGDTMVDLGSGDGRMLRAAAKRGIHAIGYEINPVMLIVSRIVTWRYRKLVQVHLADMWNLKLPECDVVYVFLLPKYMTQLHKKLQTETKHPIRLVSYAFEIPDVKPIRHNHNTFVYQYGTHPTA